MGGYTCGNAKLKISFNNYLLRPYRANFIRSSRKSPRFLYLMITRSIENIIFRPHSTCFHCRKLRSQRILITFRNFVAWIRSEKFIFRDINFLLLRFAVNKSNFKKLLPCINFCNAIVFVYCHRELQQSTVYCVFYERFSFIGFRLGLGCLASWCLREELCRAHLRVRGTVDFRSRAHLYQQLFLIGRAGNL